MEEHRYGFAPVAGDAAKFIFVQACGVIPFIGPTAAATAQSIIDLTDRSRHNKEACRYISTRVQDSLRFIAQSKYRSQAAAEAQQVYEDVLKEIRLYTIEIDKPGKFTERAKAWLMKTANANNIATANEQLLKKLDDATNRFYGSVIIDNNNKITEMQKTVEGMAAVQIMLTQKADEALTERELFELTINQSFFEDEDDDDSYINPDKNIQKRLYCGEKVAVKRIFTQELKLEQEKIAKQAKITSLLGRCNQIEKFYGTYIDYEKESGTQHLYVVTEWMPNGNLKEYLYKNKSISWPIKLKIAEQIAKGLNFCSGANVYHRDVRSKNVLLDEDLNAKLTNFEMSRRIGGMSSEMPLESLRWTAPEKIKNPRQPYTDKCEVYSFAILLWEISSHELPFGYLDSPVKASEKARDGDRPSPFPKDTPEGYKRLVMQTWQQNHSKRPSIDEIRKRLGKMRNGEKEDTRNLNCSTIPIPGTSISEDSENRPIAQLPIDKIISLHEKKRYKEAFPQFRQLAETGDPLASYYTGLYLYEGPQYGIERDEIQALQLFQKSADGGEAQGQYMYAYACLKGSYYHPDEGLRYLRKAVVINQNPDALYMVSQLFLNGEHGYPADEKKYKKHLKNAADKGSERARRELSTLS